MAPLTPSSRLAIVLSCPSPFPAANASSASAGYYSGCERSNPDAAKAAKLWGHAPAGLFGYSHLLGGYPGGQAEYLRVPFADVGPIKVPNGLSDDQVLFLSDIFPTGYMAADFCNIQAGDTIAIWGCGPVGQFAIRSAFLLGAGRVIAIDTVPERLAMAKTAGAEVLDFMKEDIYERIQDLTSGRGADACIDAVGTEPHDEAEIKKAAKDFEAMGAKVDALQADLATLEGVDKLYALIGGRSVDALLANAGRGLGKGFLDQDFDDVMRVVNTNIIGDHHQIVVIRGAAFGQFVTDAGRCAGNDRKGFGFGCHGYLARTWCRVCRTGYGRARSLVGFRQRPLTGAER